MVCFLLQAPAFFYRSPCKRNLFSDKRRHAAAVSLTSETPSIGKSLSVSGPLSRRTCPLRCCHFLQILGRLELARLFRSRRAATTEAIGGQAADCPSRSSLSAVEGKPTVVAGAPRRSKMTRSCRRDGQAQRVSGRCSKMRRCWPRTGDAPAFLVGGNTDPLSRRLVARRLRTRERDCRLCGFASIYPASHWSSLERVVLWAIMDISGPRMGHSG